MESTEKCHFFWGGIFSQWHKQGMYDPILKMRFICNEQYMMYAKAKLFGDVEMMEKIMKSTDPREQKKFGRKVKNFDQEKWETIARDVVTKANYLKFSQNRALLEQLLDFPEDTEFVEASPFDKIWGIGLGPDDDDRLDREKWLGDNWLGIAIGDARDKILADQRYWTVT